jgi:hypothetical protein
LHRPSGESIEALENPIVSSGRNVRFTPPTNASSLSPSQILRQPKWAATSEDEHAVSTARLGPTRLKKYEMRLAAMHSEEPRLVYPSMAARDSEVSCRKP